MPFIEARFLIQFELLVFGACFCSLNFFEVTIISLILLGCSTTGFYSGAFDVFAFKVIECLVGVDENGFVGGCAVGDAIVIDGDSADGFEEFDCGTAPFVIDLHSGVFVVCFAEIDVICKMRDASAFFEVERFVGSVDAFFSDAERGGGIATDKSFAYVLMVACVTLESVVGCAAGEEELQRD